jgi:integrase
MAIHLLSEGFVTSRKKPGLYGDGGGLYLQVTKAKGGGGVSKSWIFRYAVATGPDERKERKMGLGPTHTVGLAQARDKALECRQQRDKGLDPIEEKARKDREAALLVIKNITFEKAADKYIATHKGEWRSAKHQKQWRRSLELYCFKVLGGLHVRDIDDGLVVRVLEPIWNDMPTSASRIRGRIESVLDWARFSGYREGENPARWDGHLEHALTDHKQAERRTRKKEHHPALPHAQMPQFMAALRPRQTTAAQCLEFVILTAARSGEAIGAKWPEIDTDAKVWTVPPERMKGFREHRVMLSDAAIAVIDHMRKVRCSDYVFPGHRRRRPGDRSRGQPLGERSLLKVIEKMNAANKKAKLPLWVDPKEGGRHITPHGFRSSFKDWASDCTNFRTEVSEAALAHVEGDETKTAYERTTFEAKRHELMTAWANHCDGKADDAKVVPFHDRRAKGPAS